MNTRERDASLDLIRAVAALLVVLTHTITLRYPIDAGTLMDYPAGERLLCLAGFTAGRIGVPLFLMLTGHLLLPRTYDAPRIRRFYRRNLLPMLLVWEFWILAYQLYCHHLPFNLPQYLRRALFIDGADLPHSWYMPVILGIYLFLPYVSIALSHMEGRILAALMALSYISSFVFPTIQRVAISYETTVPDLVAKLDQHYSGGTYGLYLVLGYCIARYQDRLRRLLAGARAVILCMLTMALWCAAVAWEWHVYQDGYAYNIWYDNVLLPLIAAGVFLLLTRVPIAQGVRGALRRLSGSAFGIYLIHVILLQQYLWHIGPTAYGGLDVLLLLCIGYLGSLAIAMIAGRTRIGRLLLMIRAS